MEAKAKEIIKKTEATEPWKPAMILSVEDVPGMRRKWVRDELIPRFKAEGWRMVEEKVHTASTVVDGTPLDSTVRKRELVLMEITEELAKSREKFFKAKTDSALDGSVKEFEDLAGADGGKSYGKIKIEKGGA